MVTAPPALVSTDPWSSSGSSFSYQPGVLLSGAVALWRCVAEVACLSVSGQGIY